MTSEEMARSYLRSAGIILREAERLHDDEVWHLVVRRSQEAVERALKAVLRESGVEVPKVHEVGGELRKHLDRLPSRLVAEIESLVEASRALREHRELSFYGDEKSGVAAEALFSRDDADRALGRARRVVDLCSGPEEEPY